MLTLGEERLNVSGVFLMLSTSCFSPDSNYRRNLDFTRGQESFEELITQTKFLHGFVFEEILTLICPELAFFRAL